MLGVGRESILGRELVAKRGLALGAEMEFLTQRCRGLAIISATVAGDDAIATKHAMLEILEDVCRGRFSASDVERAKTLIVTSADYATQSNYGLAENLGFYETIDSVRFAETYAECIGKVTADDLAAVASKYLGKGHVGFVIRPRGKRR